MFGVGDCLFFLTVLWCGKLEASVSSWSKSRLLVRFSVEKPSWWEPSTHLRSFNDNYPIDGKHKPTTSCNSSRSFRSSTIFDVVLLHIPTQATPQVDHSHPPLLSTAAAAAGSERRSRTAGGELQPHHSPGALLPLPIPGAACRKLGDALGLPGSTRAELEVNRRVCCFVFDGEVVMPFEKWSVSVGDRRLGTTCWWCDVMLGRSGGDLDWSGVRNGKQKSSACRSERRLWRSSCKINALQLHHWWSISSHPSYMLAGVPCKPCIISTLLTFW